MARQSKGPQLTGLRPFLFSSLHAGNFNLYVRRVPGRTALPPPPPWPVHPPAPRAAYLVVRGAAWELATNSARVLRVPVAASWQGAVKVHFYARDGIDHAVVELTPWRGAGVSRVLYDGQEMRRARAEIVASTLLPRHQFMEASTPGRR
jgi:hypothetical protein